ARPNLGDMRWAPLAVFAAQPAAAAAGWQGAPVAARLDGARSELAVARLRHFSDDDILRGAVGRRQPRGLAGRGCRRRYGDCLLRQRLAHEPPLAALDRGRMVARRTGAVRDPSSAGGVAAVRCVDADAVGRTGARAVAAGCPGPPMTDY